MAPHDTEHLYQWQKPISMSRLDPRHFAAELVDQRARTKRARLRDRTVVDLAVVLGGTGAAIKVTENDGSGWSINLWPHPTGQDATA